MRGSAVVSGLCEALRGGQLRVHRAEVRVCGPDIRQQQTGAGQQAAEDRPHHNVCVQGAVVVCVVCVVLLSVTEGAARLGGGLTASTYEGLSGQHVKPSVQSRAGTGPPAGHRERRYGQRPV